MLQPDITTGFPTTGPIVTTTFSCRCSRDCSGGDGCGSFLCAVPKILLTRARLFDGKADSLKSGVQVLVDGNRIAAVDTTNSAPPDGATVIDCGDRVLMPGLIDAHWHAVYAAVPLPVLLEGDLGIIFAASTAEAERTLLRGFTTVRDLGGPTFSFKRAIDTGIIAGPRIFSRRRDDNDDWGHGDLRLPTEIPRDGGRLSTGELIELRQSSMMLAT